MSRSLDDLSGRMRPRVVELLARCCEARLIVIIVQTIRTDEEHQANLLEGTSWIDVSNHLDGRAYRNTVPGSDAIDLALFDLYQLHGPDKLQWDVEDPAWQKLGRIGEKVGLQWGGRWRTTPDCGHFEHPDARDGLTRGGTEA